VTRQEKKTLFPSKRSLSFFFVKCVMKKKRVFFPVLLFLPFLRSAPQAGAFCTSIEPLSWDMCNSVGDFAATTCTHMYVHSTGISPLKRASKRREKHSEPYDVGRLRKEKEKQNKQQQKKR
jgi:hypothetical protein